MDYSDIINLPHHVSKRHKPMSALNRAAQFAPFAALVGYEEAIIETARATDQAIELSSDLTIQLDHQLNALRHAINEHPSSPVEVSLTFFIPDERKEGGSYENISTAVKGINEATRQILLSDGRTLNIDSIVNLSLLPLSTESN